MLIQLDESDLIQCFQSELLNYSFIDPGYRSEIISNLQKLGSSRKVKGRTIINSRSTKTKAATELWYSLFQSALSYITPNIRGCNVILDYFSQYVHYENVLFAIDENHRDHVIHTIWVMLIGIYLQKKCTPFKRIYDNVFVNQTEDDKKPSGLRETERLYNNHKPALWILIALTHDLGYPIQKTLRANYVMSKMIEHFGFLTHTDFNYEFTILQQTAIDELLNTLSAGLFWVSDDIYKIGFDTGTRLDYAKSFERLDHGIMSAYLLQKNLDFICENMSVVQGLSEVTFNDIEEAATQGFIVEWLTAISDHTSSYRYFEDLHNISALLLLADELDEFSRYSRNRNTDNWTNVKCATQFHCTTNTIQFIFNFKRKSYINAEAFFKGKIGKLMDRFDFSEYDIRKLSITCIDNQSSKEVTYLYERCFDSIGEGFAKRYRGNSTYDIRGYLSHNIKI